MLQNDKTINLYFWTESGDVAAAFPAMSSMALLLIARVGIIRRPIILAAFPIPFIHQQQRAKRWREKNPCYESLLRRVRSAVGVRRNEVFQR